MATMPMMGATALSAKMKESMVNLAVTGTLRAIARIGKNSESPPISEGFALLERMLLCLWSWW